MADTTYLPVLGGFIYLMVILDLFSRKVVGWSLGDSLDAELSGAGPQEGPGQAQPSARAVVPLRPGHRIRGQELPAAAHAGGGGAEHEQER